jgi:hypothetical protein
VLHVEPHAAEIRPGLEIDHARDGIGTIYGRSAARDRLHVLDQARGDGVDVDGEVVGRRHQPAAIQQHQVAVVTNAAQVQRRGTRATRRRVRVELAGTRSGELRQGPQLGLDGEVCSLLEQFCADCHYRSVRLVIAAHDARTGDHYRGELLFVCCFSLGGCFGCGCLLGVQAGSQQHRNGCGDCCELRAIRRVDLVQDSGLEISHLKIPRFIQKCLKWHSLCRARRANDCTVNG